jgi:hypothetical protein
MPAGSGSWIFMEYLILIPSAGTWVSASSAYLSQLPLITISYCCKVPLFFSSSLWFLNPIFMYLFAVLGIELRPLHTLLRQVLYHWDTSQTTLFISGLQFNWVLEKEQKET